MPKYPLPRFRATQDQNRASSPAWPGQTSGGEILIVDVTIMPGQRSLTLTGKLGDVMKESAQAALASSCAPAQQPSDFRRRSHKEEIHVHLPEGAIPKDGPSAGITMAMAMSRRCRQPGAPTWQ